MQLDTHERGSCEADDLEVAVVVPLGLEVGQGRAGVAPRRRASRVPAANTTSSSVIYCEAYQ